jgi:murein DD-endopeptidase MepM/ murein hydrolase activator NlpD
MLRELLEGFPQLLRVVLVMVVAGVLFGGKAIVLVSTDVRGVYALPPATPTPIPGLNFPVVADTTLSGYFDHQRTTNKIVQFYDGRANPNANAGFDFTCPDKGTTDWVGCLDAVSGEGNCVNANELWYNTHNGIDFEYFPDWHTGATCNLAKFGSRVYDIPIFAAANGVVSLVSTNSGNGYHYRISYDMNRDGNSANDNYYVLYLHLRAQSGHLGNTDPVQEGDFIGYGGMTGFAFTPHLHFEVQQVVSGCPSSINCPPVDPFGWTGAGNDPYSPTSPSLWLYRGYAPGILQTCTSGCTVVTH